MSKTTHPHWSALCLMIGMVALAPLHASGDASSDDDDDDDALEHYQAREALRQGKVLPLEDIIAFVRGKFPGDIIDVEFEVEEGRYAYEIEIIQPSGQVIEIEIDALTKEILTSEEK